MAFDSASNGRTTKSSRNCKKTLGVLTLTFYLAFGSSSICTRESPVSWFYLVCKECDFAIARVYVYTRWSLYNYKIMIKYNDNLNWCNFVKRRKRSYDLVAFYSVLIPCFWSWFYYTLYSGESECSFFLEIVKIQTYLLFVTIPQNLLRDHQWFFFFLLFY